MKALNLINFEGIVYIRVGQDASTVSWSISVNCHGMSE
jgi:hypothetical protein